MLSFIIGFLSGGCFGILCMCLISANRFREEERQRKKL